MINFFQDNIKAIYYMLIVIGMVITLILLTNFLQNWLAKRANIKYPHEEPETIHLLRKIFKILWIVLGISAISFVFIDEKYYKIASRNFWLILYLGIVVLVTIIGISIVQTYFSRGIKKKQLANEDPTSLNFLRYLIIFSLYFLSFILCILAFPSLRHLAQTALGGAGILAVIAGVASQEALSNLVGGIFIIVFKPFKIHDVIKISDDLVGTVSDITLRHTIIRNYENKMIVIPNAIINKEKIVNYDLGERKCCQWIEFDVSYNCDIDKAKHIIQQECEKHPNLIENRTALEIENNAPKIITRVIGLNDSAIRIRLWAWAKDFASAFEMKCDLYESVKKQFDLVGIEIPIPQREIHIKANNYFKTQQSSA